MVALGLLYLMLFLLWLPLMAVQSHRAISAGHPMPSRQQLFVQVMFMQSVFALFSLLVARVYRIPLFPPFELRWSAVAAAGAVLVAMLISIPLRWRAITPEQKRRLMHTRPRSWNDMGYWTLISAAAGFCEELAYRGVLFSILWHFTGSPWIAAGISATAFAFGHAIQGWRAGLVIFLFALAAHGIVWLAGSLYVMMLLHFVYDVAAGYVYMRLSAAEPT